MKKFVLTTLALLFLAACVQVAEEPIKIGAILPLTGDDSFWGENAKNGIMLALEDVNTKGGINGRELEVVFEDGKCDPKNSVTAMQKLVEIDGVKAVVGEVCSSATLAIAPIAQNNKVVLVAPCSESPAISEAGDYVFRTWTPNNRQARTMAKYANEAGLNKIAVLNIDNDFGNSLAKAFVEEFSKLGGTIIASDKYGKEDQDFRTQLTKIKAANPDAFYLISYQKDGIGVIRQMNELGINSRILATSGINSVDDFFKPLGQLAEGIVFSDLKDSTIEEFRERYAEKYGKEWPGMGSCAGVAYDDLMLIAEAMRQVGADAQKMKDVLAGMRDFQGVSGPITFDANGDLDREHVIFFVQNGKPVEK
jgi:branched-chain amino acid transport system substrate-binding protein